MIQCTVSPRAMEFSVLFHFEKTNSLTQISWCFQRPTRMTSLEWPLWKLFLQITDYMNLVTNFKRHSNRLKLTCSWNLVHFLLYMQLATFFFFFFWELQDNWKPFADVLAWSTGLGMTTSMSSSHTLDTLIAKFLSVPSRNGNCCSRTALCPLFRDANCVECEVYYVKLLTVIHEVNK